MGYLDRLQGRIAQAEEDRRRPGRAERHDNLERQLEERRQANPEVPYIELLRAPRASGDDAAEVIPLRVVDYLTQVGIRPEDSYGIFPSRVTGDFASFEEISVAYRDRPEYEAARQRFWQTA